MTGWSFIAARILPGLLPRVESFFSHPAETLWYAGRILRMKGASHEAGRNYGGVCGGGRERPIAVRGGPFRAGGVMRGPGGKGPGAQLGPRGHNRGPLHSLPRTALS